MCTERQERRPHSDRFLSAAHLSTHGPHHPGPAELVRLQAVFLNNDNNGYSPTDIPCGILHMPLQLRQPIDRHTTTTTCPSFKTLPRASSNDIKVLSKHSIKTLELSPKRISGLLRPFNPLKAELNPICHLLTLLGAHLNFHVSRIRVKALCSTSSAGAAEFTCSAGCSTNHKLQASRSFWPHG